MFLVGGLLGVCHIWLLRLFRLLTYICRASLREFDPPPLPTPLSIFYVLILRPLSGHLVHPQLHWVAYTFVSKILFTFNGTGYERFYI